MRQFNINRGKSNQSRHSLMTERIVVNNFAEVVWNAIPKKNGCKYPIIMHEVDCHRGRADVVCAVIRKNNFDFSKLELLGTSLSQPAKAKIISWLNKGFSSSEEYLCKVAGLGVKTVRKHLNELLQLRSVQRNTVGDWVLSKEFKLPDIEIWAFEVKLHNWKRAYYQALRYRGFSHYATVVMPSENLRKPTENIDMFHRMNIGLMAIDKRGEVEYINKPKKKEPTSRRHYLYALGQILVEYCRRYPALKHETNFGFVPFLRRLLG